MTDETENLQPPLPAIRLGPMRGAADYRRALHRLARGVLQGRVQPRVAGTVGYLLGMAIKALEVQVLEERLAAVESTLGLSDRPGSARMVGHG